MENKKKEILVIGHFGGNHSFFDGQTVKTKVLCDELEKDFVVHKLDTYYKKNIFKFYIPFLKLTKRYDDILVLLSQKGMKMLFPYLSYIAKKRKKRIYHDVIGGNICSLIKKNKSLKNQLSCFVVNWVESKKLVDDLNRIGVFNAEYLPNFKNINIEYCPYIENTFKFCTFSRVIEEKGITLAINTIKKINTEKNNSCKLTIYGPVDKHYANKFYSLIKCDSNINYGGIINQDKIVDTLKTYYMLLFPTYWYGEGFPGTIIDSFASSLPVIASDFAYNREIINNLETGIVYPQGDFLDLYDAIIFAIENKKQILQMKENCKQEASKYLSSNCIKTVVDKINYPFGKK